MSCAHKGSVIFEIIDKFKYLCILSETYTIYVSDTVLYKAIYMSSKLALENNRLQQRYNYIMQIQIVLFMSAYKNKFFSDTQQCFIFSIVKTASKSWACFVSRAEIQYLCHGPSSKHCLARHNQQIKSSTCRFQREKLRLNFAKCL